MTFNTALKACGNAGRLDQALRVYAALVSRGVRPSVTTFALLLAAAAAADSPQTVRMVHSVSTFPPSHCTQHALSAQYQQCLPNLAWLFACLLCTWTCPN